MKDNIHVEGLPSTGNCPGFGGIATSTAPVVGAAQNAGAILIGKNTMDQFATGLNGTRSPDPICVNAINADIIPGGSSSGSAVAGARGICGFSFGSDTGRSGRVPAASNGIVGVKPTPGLLSGRGLLYCNRSFDVIPIFAKTVADAWTIFEVVAGPDDQNPYAYTGSMASLDLPENPRIAITSTLDHFGDSAAATAHESNLLLLEDMGASLTSIDFAHFAEAGDMVFNSALVAEHLVDYGDFIKSHAEAVVPAVATAVNAGRTHSARDAHIAMHRLAELKLECLSVSSTVDFLALPTIPRLYTVAEMLMIPWP